MLLCHSVFVGRRALRVGAIGPVFIFTSLNKETPVPGAGDLHMSLYISHGTHAPHGRHSQT